MTVHKETFITLLVKSHTLQCKIQSIVLKINSQNYIFSQFWVKKKPHTAGSGHSVGAVLFQSLHIL